MAKVSTLTYNFATQDNTNWSGWNAGTAVSSGQLVLTPDAAYTGSIVTSATYDFSSSNVFAEIASTVWGTSTEQYFVVMSDLVPTDECSFAFTNTQLYCQVRHLSTVIDQTSFVYNAIAHRCVRLRESGGTVFFDTSPDGSTWTNRFSTSALGAINWTNSYVKFQAGYWGTESAPGLAKFDNLNLVPSLSPGKGSWPFRYSARTNSSQMLRRQHVNDASTVAHNFFFGTGNGLRPYPTTVVATAAVNTPTVTVPVHVTINPSTVAATATVQTAQAMIPSTTTKVQSTSATSGTTNTTVAATLTGVTVGNMLVAMAAFDKAAGTISATAGWTILYQNSSTSLSIAMAFKVASSTSETITFTRTTTGVSGDTIWVGEFTDTKPGLWYYTSGGVGTDELTYTSFSAPTLGPYTDPGLVVSGFAIDSNNTATQSFGGGFTQDRAWGTSGAPGEIAVGILQNLLAGQSATATHTHAVGSDDQMAAVSIWLEREPVDATVSGLSPAPATASVGAVTVDAPTVAVVTTVARTAAVNAPTVSTNTNATVNPSTVASIAAVGSPTMTAGTSASVSATTVVSAAVVNVPTMTAGTGASVSATTVARTSAVNAAVESIGVTASPSVVTAATIVNTPTATANISATASVSTVARAAVVNAPGVGYGYSITPATVVATATVESPFVVAGGSLTANPATVTTTATTNTPTMLAGVGVTVGALTVARTATTPSVASIAVGSTTSPSTVTISAQTNVATIGAGSTVSPATVGRTAIVNAPSISAGSGTGPVVGSISSNAVVGAPSVSAGVGSTVNPTVVSALVIVPTPAITIAPFFTPGTVIATAAVYTPVIGSGAGASPSTVARTASVNNVTDVDDEKRTLPSTIPATSAIGTVTISAGQNPSPSAVVSTAIVNAPSVNAGQAGAAAPSTIGAMAAVNAPLVSTGTVVAVSTIARVATVSVPATILDQTVLPSTIASTVAVNIPTGSSSTRVDAATVARVAFTNASGTSSGATVGHVTIARPAVVGLPVITISSTVFAVTIARAWVVNSVAEIVEGESTVVHPLTIARLASTWLPRPRATQNDYAYGDPTAAYYNPGLAMDVNKELTRIYIAENPFSVVLQPHAKSRTNTGGYTLTASLPRVAQVTRFIEGTTSVGIGQSRTNDGFQEADTHMLLMEWDALVEVNDTFERNGIPYVVTAVMENNGYSTRAEVMRRG